MRTTKAVMIAACLGAGLAQAASAGQSAAQPARTSFQKHTATARRAAGIVADTAAERRAR